MTYVVGALIGVVGVWLGLVLAVVALRPKGLRAADVARLMPDLVRLLRRLARDPSLPRPVRVRVWLLLAWVASPIDLIPDFVPVVGLADDVVLAYVVLRSVVRAAGDDVLARHWPGSAAGLAAVERLVGVARRTGS